MVEHLWALPLRNVVREAGGILLSQDFLSPETLIGLAASYSQPLSNKGESTWDQWDEEAEDVD
jgi:hypothetical protein